MTILTRMVKSSGMRFTLLSFHSALNSSLWFFFITMALRKGAMSRMVSTPVMALAYHWYFSPGKTLCMMGSTNVNIKATEAEERMP